MIVGNDANPLESRTIVTTATVALAGMTLLVIAQQADSSIACGEIK